MDPKPELTAFAARLNEVCDDKGMPPKYQARQRNLGARFSVSQNAARKWLEGQGFPALETAIAIARWGDVGVEWLLTGRGPKHIAGGEYIPSAPSARIMRVMESSPPYVVEQLAEVVELFAKASAPREHE